MTTIELLKKHPEHALKIYIHSSFKNQEVIDMIKDLSETMYYCSIVKAMEEGEQDKVHHMTQTTHPATK